MAISDVAKLTPGQGIKGPTCTVCQQLAALPDPESAALVKLLENPRWRYQELADALAGQGVDLPASALSRHARGRCAARTRLRRA